MKSFSTKENYPTMNFIWIGPPTFNENKGIKGHDVNAAKRASECIKNPIVFWCLGTHLEYYQKYFLNTRVICRDIESYLAQKFTESSIKELATKVLEIYKVLMGDKVRAQNRRDRTTFKVAFAYFLLHQVGGYIIDSNVFPTSKNLVLPAYDKLMMPIMRDGLGIQAVVNSLDIWTLYAPPGLPITKKIFLNFYSQWATVAEKIYQLQGHSQEYYQAVIAAVIDKTFDISDVLNNNIGVWIGQKPGSPFSSPISILLSIGLEKYYYNTHKHNNKNLYEQKENLIKDNLFAFFPGVKGALIRTLVQEYVGDDIEEVKSDAHAKVKSNALAFLHIANGDSLALCQLILSGGDPNQRMSGKTSNEVTLLHHAILQEMKAGQIRDDARAQNISVCRRFLKNHGADLNLLANCALTDRLFIIKSAGDLDQMLESGSLLDYAVELEDDYYREYRTESTSVEKSVITQPTAVLR